MGCATSKNSQPTHFFQHSKKNISTSRPRNCIICQIEPQFYPNINLDYINNSIETIKYNQLIGNTGQWVYHCSCLNN